MRKNSLRTACAITLALAATLAAPRDPAAAEPVRAATPSQIQPSQVQPSQPPSAPATPEPQRTTATFDDWTLRCIRPDKAPALCEVSQTVMNQSQQPVAQTALGRPPGEPIRLTALVPPNILIATAPRLVAPDQTIEMAWRRCLSNGCVADANVNDAQVKRLRDLKDNARLLYQDAGGREMIVPFSPKGLPAALDALAKEPG